MNGAKAEARAVGGLRLAVLGLFVWVCIEDETRKLLGAPLAVYAVKDLLVALSVTLSVRGAPPHFLRRALPASLRAVLLWGLLLYVLGSLHPGLESFLIPLNGIHMTFFALPMLFVGARFAAWPREVERLLWVMLALSAGVASVGLWQALVDPAFLNPLPDEMQPGWLVGIVRGEVPYVSGPFLSPGRYVTHLMNGAAAGLCLYLLSASSRRRLLALAVALVVGAGLVMSGARTGPVVLALLLVAALGILEMRRRGGTSPVDRDGRKWAVRLVVATATVVGMALASSERMTSTLGFYWESLFTEGGEGLRTRAEADLGLASFDASTWLFGHGTGSASFGIQYVFPDFVPTTEGGYSSLVWELGVLGLVFYLALAAQLSLVFLASPRRRSPLVDGLVPAFGALVLIELWILNMTGFVLQQYVVAIPLWFFTGLVWNLGSGNRSTT